MAVLREIFSKRFHSSKSPFEYELYRYEDIQSQWIIHQGYLQYLHHTTILGDSQFKPYLVVLTRIPIENMEDIIGLYLFSEKKKYSSHFFLVDQRIKVNDRCNRMIKPQPKCFLMELQFIEKDKPEIFGTKDNSERQIWVEVFKNISSKPKLLIAVSDSSYLLPDTEVEPKNKPANSSTLGIKIRNSPLCSALIAKNCGRSYPSFNLDYSYRNNSENDIHKNKQRSPTQTNSRTLPCSIIEPTDYSRLSATNNKQFSASCLELQSKTDLHLLQQNTLLWNDIFYLNKNNDYESILVKCGEYGAFLIRPQSKKTSSNDHDYTLCIYYKLNDIRCFAIYQLPTRKNGYSLSKSGFQSFVDMSHLCQYYTTNPLPISSNNFSLKNPYKSYKTKF